MQDDFGSLATTVGRRELQATHSNLQDSGLVLQGTRPECQFSSLSVAHHLSWCSAINLDGLPPAPPGGAVSMDLRRSLSEANIALWLGALQHQANVLYLPVVSTVFGTVVWLCQSTFSHLPITSHCCGLRAPGDNSCFQHTVAQFVAMLLVLTPMIFST